MPRSARSRELQRLDGSSARTERNNQLQEELANERRQEADGIAADVETAGGSHECILNVETKITELGGELTKSASESEEAVAAKTEEMKEALLEMKELLQKTRTELSDKIHEENVTCYRNIQDTV